jgi:hypothetical protein
MDESESKKEMLKEQRLYSQEQFEILNRCSAEKDMSKWNQWRKENSTKDVLLEGAAFWHAYLKNADLGLANLQRADLRGANLEGANLQNAILWEANLQGANLRESHLQRAKLMRSQLQGAEFGGARLQGADFSRAIVDGGTLIWRCKVDIETKFEGVGLGAARIYPELKQLLEYNIRRKNWEEWYKEHPKLTWLVKPFWLMSDYGLSTGRIIVTFFALAFIFANIYYHWGRIAPPGIVEYLFIDRNGIVVPSWLVPLRTLYFSVVTMTTLGFGDMYANAQSIWGHVLLSLQVILGYVLLGALVTRFAVLFTAGGPAGKFADDRRQMTEDRSLP